MDKLTGIGVIKIANLEALIAKSGSNRFHMELIISIKEQIFPPQEIGHGLYLLAIKPIDSMVILRAHVKAFSNHNPRVWSSSGTYFEFRFSR